MANWLTLSSTGGTGNTNITITASSNTNSATDRSQSFKVTAGNKIVNFIVVQDDDYKEIHINPTAVTTVGERTAIVDVITEYAWTATTPSGITLSQSTGSGNTRIEVSCQIAQADLIKTYSVTFSTVNDSAILKIKHIISDVYITAYYNIVNTGSTYIASDDTYQYSPYMSVDNGDWIPTEASYIFNTTGQHIVKFMIAKYVKRGNTTFQYQYYIMPNGMFAMFGLDTHITTVLVGEGIERIEQRAIDCEYVTTIYLPSTVNWIQHMSFYYLTSLTDVYITAAVQPPCVYVNSVANTYESFLYINRNGTLHYPAGSDYSVWMAYLQFTAPDTGIEYHGLSYYGWTGVADL